MDREITGADDGARVLPFVGNNDIYGFMAAAPQADLVELRPAVTQPKDIAAERLSTETPFSSGFNAAAPRVLRPRP